MLRFRHYEGHDFGDGSVADTVKHRARLGLAATYDKRFGVMVQVQDVRLWGEEANTLGDFVANGFDLHQGYLRVMPFKGMELRAGRQEIAFENHRLIGTVGWLEQARSFDALRIMFKHGMWRVDTFYSKIGEDASTATDAAGNPIHPDDKDVLAGNIHIAPFKELEIGLVDVLNINDVNGQKRYTVGGIISGKTSFGLSYSAEGYYQGGGADGDVDYSAYMFAVNPKFTVKSLSTKPFIAARFEMISGDSDPNDNTVKSFDTLFATNHKFYGEMDFFLNLPVHSGARGLMDIGPTVGWSPHKTVSVKLSHHYFRAAATRDDDLKEFGHEIDAKAVFKPYKGLAFDFNYSAFVPGDVFKSTTGSDDAEHFIYTTANAKF